MLKEVFYSDEAWFELSGEVNSPTITNLETLKANITREINKIPRTVLTNIAGNVVMWVRACILAAGGQFEHLL